VRESTRRLARANVRASARERVPRGCHNLRSRGNRLERKCALARIHLGSSPYFGQSKTSVGGGAGKFVFHGLCSLRYETHEDWAGPRIRNLQGNRGEGTTPRMASIPNASPQNLSSTAGTIRGLHDNRGFHRSMVLRWLKGSRVHLRIVVLCVNDSRRMLVLGSTPTRFRQLADDSIGLAGVRNLKAGSQPWVLFSFCSQI
jgi:hypothetical protein